MKRLPIIILFLFYASTCFAQPVSYPGLAKRLRNGTTLPTTCAIGDVFFDTDATSGQRFYACESANTWALQGDGGGSASISDAIYGAGWDGVTTVAPSKNAVYDKIETIAASGDPVLVDTVAVSDASGVDLTGGTTGIDITFNAAVSPDTAIFGIDLTEITCGAGLACASATAIATDSTEAAFLASGALTCGAGTAGKIQVHTTPIQYCDNAATPTLRYGAYGDSSGVASSTASDSTWTSHNSYPSGCAASNWVTTIGDTLTCAQPAFTDISGAATDAQVPNTITIDLATLATTATTANAGDSATSFFSTGTLEEGLLPDSATVTGWALGASTAATSLTSPAFISNNADPADAGIFRLGNAENIAWEASPAGTDETLTVSSAGNFQISGPIEIDASDPADAEAIRLDNAEGIAWEASPTGTDVTLKVDASEILQASGAFNAGGAITGSNLSGTNTGDNDQVGTVTSGNLCTADGSAVQCTTVPATGILTWLATPSSANLGTALTDETGSGAAVFGTSPTFTTSMIIPQGTAPTVNAAGNIAQDTTDDQFLYGATPRVIPYTYEICFSLETVAVADDNVPIWSPVDAITITGMYCRTQGGTSAEMQISDGTNVAESIVCDSDGQADDGSIANGTFTANERMEFDTIAVTGSVTWVNYCVRYVTDRQ